jgi:hypothetical protein
VCVEVMAIQHKGGNCNVTVWGWQGWEGLGVHRYAGIGVYKVG